MSQIMSTGPRRDEATMSLITRACDMCRKKKIRCEILSGICAQCIKYKTPCHFTPISVKRAPRRSVRDKHIEDLEKRLKRMEEQLKLAAGAQPRNDAVTKDGPGSLETPNSDQFQTGNIFLDEQHEVDKTMKQAFPAAEVPPLSPGFDLPFQNAPYTSVSNNQIAFTHYWNITPENTVSAKPTLNVLPPKDKALSLIQKSFQGFNKAFPLFDQEAFMSAFESEDTRSSDPGWWACLNVVLALTHRFKGTTTLDKDEDREAWGYFQNALAVSNQLITMHATLSSIQALLGMAILIQGTPNQGPVSLLTSSAIKIAQRMGLHRQCQQHGLSLAEIEERKRVFWIAYALDKDISLQTGQPPTQDDDDMDVDLPFNSNNTLTVPGNPSEADYFNFRVRLAMIQGQIYKRLCSVRASRQTNHELVMAARGLEGMLSSWRAYVPDDFLRDYCGPGHCGLNSMPSDPTRHPIILQLAYFNSLSTVYSFLPMFPMYHELQGPTDPDICVEARKAIKLLQITPRRNYACIWAVLNIFVTATTTLLTYILSNPTSPAARVDLKLIEPLLKLLGVLARSDQGSEVSGMYCSCVELFKKARMAIESSHIPTPTRNQGVLKGQPERKENVEDFLKRMESISSGYGEIDLSLISPNAHQYGFGNEY